MILGVFSLIVTDGSHTLLSDEQVWATLDRLHKGHKWLCCPVHSNNLLLLFLINAAFRGLASCAVCASESGISAAVNGPAHSEDVRRLCFKANLTDRAKIDNLCCCSCVLTQLISARAQDDSLEKQMIFSWWVVCDNYSNCRYHDVYYLCLCV